MGWSGWSKIADNKIILAAANEVPNKLHLFADDNNGRIVHQGDTVDDEWLDFCPSSDVDGLGVTCWDQGRIDVVTIDLSGFAAQPKHCFRFNFPFGDWTSWQLLGGPPLYVSNPAITAERPGQLNMFAMGVDNSIVHRWYLNNEWTGGPESLGGVGAPIAGPAACSWGPGRQDVFYVRAGGDIVHKFYDNGWSGWDSLGGYWTAPPIATSWPGRIDLFCAGQDRQIHHRVFLDGRWSADWDSLGGTVHEMHRIVACSGGRGGPLRVFHTGTDLAIYVNWLM